MSNFAFGTYRISEHNPQHIAALKEAINSGITMIDTSSNYMDGSAERAIAQVLADTSAEVEVVTKFGYIQNTNMKIHKETPFDEVVEYRADCFHCISQDFIEHQLGESLKSLQMDTLDCYLIHNPEYYILDAINRGIEKDARLDEMYKRLFDAFLSLELAIQNNKILSYGISSNSFSKPRNSEEFLPYEDLLTLAQEAAQEIGNETHGFTTIELPINIVEREGLKCAAWAKENKLRVLVNRPLNAQHNGLMYRLADYDESHDYYHHLNEVMELSENEALRPLYNLLEQLDENKHRFGWIGDYDSFLYTQIVPHVKTTIENLDAANMETMINAIDAFLTEYRKMVAYECSKSTRTALKEIFEGCYASMQECALKFLMQHESVDTILIGMRKPKYVHEILQLQE